MMRLVLTHKCSDKQLTGGHLDEPAPKYLNLEKQDNHIIKAGGILGTDKHSIKVMLMQ